MNNRIDYILTAFVEEPHEAGTLPNFRCISRDDETKEVATITWHDEGFGYILKPTEVGLSLPEEVMLRVEFECNHFTIHLMLLVGGVLTTGENFERLKQQLNELYEKIRRN